MALDAYEHFAQVLLITAGDAVSDGPVVAVGWWTRSVRQDELAFPENRVAILHGPNGWGKTTMLQSIANIGNALSGNLPPLGIGEFDSCFLKFSSGQIILVTRIAGVVRIGASQPERRQQAALTNRNVCRSCAAQADACTCVDFEVVTYDRGTFERIDAKRHEQRALQAHDAKRSWWNEIETYCSLEGEQWQWNHERDRIGAAYAGHAPSIHESNDFRRDYHAAMATSAQAYRKRNFRDDFASPSQLAVHFERERPQFPAIGYEICDSPFGLLDQLGLLPGTRNEAPSFSSYRPELLKQDVSGVINRFRHVADDFEVQFARVDRVEKRLARPIPLAVQGGPSGQSTSPSVTMQVQPGSYEASQQLLAQRLERFSSQLQQPFLGDVFTADGSLGDASTRIPKFDADGTPQSAEQALARAEDEIYHRYQDLVEFGILGSARALARPKNMSPGQQEMYYKLLRVEIDRLKQLDDEIDRFKFFRAFVERGLEDISFTVGTPYGFEFQDYHVTLGPWQLSSGNQQRVSIALSALFETERGGMLLIDEPELSLDVRWQRVLVNDLSQMARIAGIQILLSTHSPQIVTGHEDKLTPPLLEQDYPDLGQ